MFRRNGLALHSGTALVGNTGLDGSGVHCPPTDKFDVILRQTPLDPSTFPKEIIESKAALQAMIDFRHSLRPNVVTRARRSAGRIARRFGLLAPLPESRA